MTTDLSKNSVEELEDVLLRNGFVRCDIAACNCGSWHPSYGLYERFNEIKDTLAEAGHPLCNGNGNLTLNALKELVAERDSLSSRLEEAQEAAKHWEDTCTGEWESHNKTREKLKEAQQQLDRAFQVLELHGVPRQRARFVGNGIEVLVTRLSREIEEAQQRNAAHDAKVAAEAKAEALEEAIVIMVSLDQAEAGPKCWDDPVKYCTKLLRDKAAEYRAKAGRKE